MGLFTNRKRDEDDDDIVASAEILSFASEMPGMAESPGLADTAVMHDTPPPPDAPMLDEDPAVPAMPAAPGWMASGALGSDVPPAPKRRLEDRPRVQAGNVEIDVEGLLALLGVEEGASLIDISEATQRFLQEHRIVDLDDPDAAALKERIRREVNTAYASFRLTHAD